VRAICNTVDVASAIEADAVIFHLGSHLGAGVEVGLERACAALAEILEHCEGDTWLCMENSAGTGATIGRSLTELGVLLERLDRHPRLGVCLDSCHLYVSGYDVTDRGAVDELVAELAERIGLERLRALHINDSAAELGSNRDRHANIMEGLMGEGLGAFLAHPAFQQPTDVVPRGVQFVVGHVKCFTDAWIAGRYIFHEDAIYPQLLAKGGLIEIFDYCPEG